MPRADPFSCIGLLRLTPGQSRSTINALMPRWRASGSVLAKMTKKPATGALVIQVFVPLRRYVVALLDGRRKNARHVRTGGRLGQTVSPEFTAPESSRGR